MGVHPNIHIPKESFPQWIWYAIECVIVIAISLLVSKEITNSIEGISPEIQNYIFILVS
jgi:bacteriorhodopsin